MESELGAACPALPAPDPAHSAASPPLPRPVTPGAALRLRRCPSRLRSAPWGRARGQDAWVLGGGEWGGAGGPGGPREAVVVAHGGLSWPPDSAWGRGGGPDAWAAPQGDTHGASGALLRCQGGSGLPEGGGGVTWVVESGGEGGAQGRGFGFPRAGEAVWVPQGGGGGGGEGARVLSSFVGGHTPGSLGGDGGE